MARPPRIEYPNALYHVTSRGKDRQDIFTDNADRQQWLEIFASVCNRMKWRCYGYCLMDSHYHIIIETPLANLAQGMRQLNGVYTQKTNFRHQRSGQIYQGRYKAIIFDKEKYLLEVCRHVALNPVRAGLVAKSQDWEWSSHPATSGKAEVPEWLHPKTVLTILSTNIPLAQSAYRSFVRQGINLSNLWDNVRNQIYLGDENFVRATQARINKETRGKKTPNQQNRLTQDPLTTYRDNFTDKQEAVAHAFLDGHHTMKEIGDFFDIHYSTVSRWVKRFEEKHRES